LDPVDPDLLESAAAKGGLLLRLLRSKFLSDTKGEAIFPLSVLTALYFFDEFDTAAFLTLAPDIKRSFGLTDERFIGLVIANVSLVVLLAVPVGYLADRVSRVKLVVLSGVLAGSFSLATGLSTSVLFLTFARFGNGVGLLANVPIHNSLLADYYTPPARPTVFANHTNAMYLGAIFGPAVAGIAGTLLGWRAAFFFLFVPIAITTVVAIRLVEPARGGTDKPGDPSPETQAPPKFREAVRTLWAIRTLRRTMLASVFLGAGLIPLIGYLSLFFEREFGVGAFGRGLIGAANAACTFVGVHQGGRLTPGWFAKGMHVPMRRVGLAVSVVGPGLLLTAASPWLALTVGIGLVTNYLLGFLFAPLAAVQALVSPARERSLSFSLGAIFLVLGVILFFAMGLGSISDNYGIRWAFVALAPFWVLGGITAASAGKFVERDVQAAFA
jgi:branched-chain amino acid transport system ATP-binding protein